MYRSTQECAGVHRSVQECTGVYRNAQDCTGMRKSVEKRTGVYRSPQEWPHLASPPTFPTRRHPPSHSLGHASEFCKSLGFVNPERDSRWQRVIFTLYACCPYTLHDPRNQTEVLALHGTARGSAVAHVLYYTRAHVHTPRDPGRSVAPTHPAASVRGYRT